MQKNIESVAVIDLGSNSCRMQVTQIINGSFLKTGTQLKEYVRLSEGMGPEKTLKPEPIARTLATLKTFKNTYDKLPNLHLIAIATAAARQAANQKEFLDLVKKETGIAFNVIPGEEEARLDYLGVVRTLPVDDCLIVDTGGASTELILVKDGEANERISIPFGAVTNSADFNLGDKISAVNLFDAMTFVEQALFEIPWIHEAYEMPLVCLGGSNRSLAKISRRRLDCDPDDIPDLHGYTISVADAIEIMRELIGTDKKGRENIPGLTKSRSDVIVGGLIPLTIIMRVCHISEVVCSAHGLREGALFDYLDSKKKK